MRAFPSVALGGLLLALGIPIVLAGEALARALGVHTAPVLIGLFIIYNFVLARTLGLRGTMARYWSARKAPHFLWGCCCGAALAGASFLVLLASGQGVSVSDPNQLSWAGAGMTLLIVSWEELWFRGAPLNYLNVRLSALSASIFASVVFVLMHCLNPDIDLARSGVNLFLGGMALSLSLFVFESLWFSIGLHLAWNQLGDSFGEILFGVAFPNDALWGASGVAPNLVLFAYCLCLAYVTIRRSRRAHH